MAGQPASDELPAPAPARSIERLSEEVVNRIAAGEVIHRPVSAIKEMIENSVDAGASTIKIRTTNGGIKSFVVQDNGGGIREADLPIVCERFTTSKLRTFDDLREIGTYGFRGEALASISHVAKVSITSKTADSPCAFKASYACGQLVPPGPGQPEKPRPCAGTDGTTIVVDDLFYNLSARKRVVKNAGEEYARILGVVSKYAVHRGLSEEAKAENLAGGGSPKLGVGFTCKKAASSTPDIHTSASDSKLDNIRSIHGSQVANELIHVAGTSTQFREEEGEDGSDGEQAEESTRAAEDALLVKDASWSYDGYVSNANYHKKKSTCFFFINDRLVNCASLKRSLDALYAEYLPKGTYPFVYLSIHMPPQHVDVNVHPNKREVHFLCESSIVRQVTHGIRTKLAGANASRVFYTQQTIGSQCELIAGGAEDAEDLASMADGSACPATPMSRKRPRARAGEVGGEEAGEAEGQGASQLTAAARTPASSSAAKRYQPHKLVRTDPNSGGLDAFFKRAAFSASSQLSPAGAAGPAKALSSAAMEPDAAEGQSQVSAEFVKLPPGTFDNTESEDAGELTSVRELVDAFEKRRSDRLKEMLGDLVFVGWMDETFCLVQIHTGLFLMDYVEFCRELFYQRALRSFGRFKRIVLVEPVELRPVLEAALLARAAARGIPEDRPWAAEAEKLVDFLVQRESMLDEYFRIRIDPATGTLSSLPELVDGYLPQAAAIPAFLLRLCEHVEWFDEKGCFDSIACEIAEFYAQLGMPAPPQAGADADHKWVHDKDDPRFVLKNVLVPALRRSFLPYKEHADAERGFLRQIAALEVLYKIFERC